LKWLQEIRGNARGCLIYEPMFILPFSMYTTYATVYMVRLGVSAAQIGLIASLGLILQLFSSAVSGHITDWLGRKRALLYFDLVSWTLGTFIWMIADNVWFFVAAAVVNSFQRIPTTAWYCLLVEDTEPSVRAPVFTGLQLISVLGGLFSPLGGVLIAHLNVVPAVRVMYGMAFLGMTAMFFLRNRAVHETEIGKRKMIEARSVAIVEVIRQYRSIAREIFADRMVIAVFAVYVLNNFQAIIVTTFVSVYQVSALGIPAAWIALFPAVSSVVTLVIIYVVVPKLRPEHAQRYVRLGFILSIVGSVMLILAPHGQIGYMALASTVSAAGTVIANPFLETLTANSIRDDERAKFLSVLSVLILLFTWPAGVIGGWTYGLYPRATFAIVALVLGAGVWVLWRLQKKSS